MGSSLCISVITKNSNNPAYAGARIGVDRTLSRYGARAVHYSPILPDDIGEQSQLIKRAITDRPDAILLAPAHVTLLSDAIDSIRKSEIPLFCFVSEPKCSSVITFVGSNDFQLGKAMANYLASYLNGDGEIVIVNGHPDAATTIPRAKGFCEGLESFPNIVLRDQIVGNYQREIAASAFENLIRAKRLPDGVLAANDFMACGILDVLKLRGVRIPVVGANATPDSIALIKKGDMIASAAFDAFSMGAIAAELAIRYLQGSRVPRAIELPVQMVDCNNVIDWDKLFEERRMYTWEQALAFEKR